MLGSLYSALCIIADMTEEETVHRTEAKCRSTFHIGLESIGS